MVAELELWQAAADTGEYRYFHMISGSHYPVKSNSYIKKYFNDNNGTNFIRYREKDKEEPRFRMRMDQYHFLQDSLIGKKRNGWKYLDFASCYVQKFLGIKRFRGQELKQYVNWLSVTNEVVNIILKKKAYFLKKYKYTYCPVEQYILTEIWDTPLRNTISPKGNLNYVVWKK